MVKVENRKTLWFLTKQFLKINRARNFIAILAIILTSTLFTTLFTGAGSLFLSQLETNKKKYITDCHAIIQQLSSEEGQRAEAVLKDVSFVEKYGKDIFLGIASGENFPYLLELHAGDENSARNRFALPTQGRMPQTKDEIAVSTTVLDALGIPHKTGEKITLPVSVSDGAPEEETFTLCGYWKGDLVSQYQFAWVSEDYAQEKLASDALDGASDTSDNISGNVFSYAVWFKNTRTISENIRALNALSGLSESGRSSNGFSISPAYEIAFSGEGGISVSSIAAFLVVILLAGYLIIYNIFNISVKNDIRTYGLLKNVGTTGKQLKKIVRMQALVLSAAGIPIGLAAGYIAGVLLIPVLTASLNEKTETVSTAHPLIFLFSAAFSLLTVYLSVLQACRIAARVSPVEALRLAENPQTRRKNKKNFSVSCTGMALQNMSGNWKKGVIVMLSIAISLTTLNVAGILISRHNFKDISDLYLAADFQLSKLTSTADFADFHTISPEIRQTLDVCLYAQETGYTYFSRETLSMPEHLRKTYKRITNKYLKQWGYDWDETWQEISSSNQIPVLYMGISRAVFDQLDWRGEPASWEDFQSGQYVIVNYPYNYYVDKTDYYYKKGDSLTMTCQNGEEKTYEVLEEAMLPYLLDFPYTELISVKVYIPDTEYIVCTGDNSAMRAIINAIPGQEKKVQQYIEELILTEDDTFQFTSVLDLKKDFNRYLSKYYIIGGLLAFVLALIGIMNFYNTTATSLISRKKELALLEAVGMTKKQLLGMLVFEGLFYLCGAVIMAGILTFLYSRRFTDRAIPLYAFLPFALMIPVLLFIAWAIPKVQFRKMNRESVVERIRQQ